MSFICHAIMDGEESLWLEAPISVGIRIPFKLSRMFKCAMICLITPQWGKCNQCYQENKDDKYWIGTG